MTSRLHAAVAAACVLLALTGCSASPKSQLRSKVQSLTLDANGHDASAVRSDAQGVIDLVPKAVASGDVTAAQGARITALATTIRDRAGLLDASPTPAPTSAAPTPSRSASRSPSPSPSPTPSPTPVVTTAPPTTPPSVSPTVLPTLSPVAATGSVLPSAAPSPTP